MSLYIFQSIVLGSALVIFARRENQFNAYQILFALVWTISVIAIKIIYGADQANFYSNDQGTQIELLNKFISEGPIFSLDKIIDGRYVVIIPVWFLKMFGIDPLLGFKFLQAVSLVYLYRLCSDHLKRQGITLKTWHAILFAGPLFIFLSAIGLRDLEIALFTTYFFLGQIPSVRILSLGLTALLRPHLAIALIFGWLVSVFLKRFPPKRIYILLVALSVGAFVSGGYGYAIGGLFKYKLNYEAPIVLTQEAWWRFFANLIGLQFLSFGTDIVKMTVGQLLVLRLFFIDTFLIPLLFIFTLLNQHARHSVMRIQVFVSFIFFLGLVSQTNFNSSRQNLPFLSTMGVLALLGILKAKEQVPESTNLQTEKFSRSN